MYAMQLSSAIVRESLVRMLSALLLLTAAASIPYERSQETSSEVARLIKDLSNSDDNVSNAAMNSLVKIGKPAVNALFKATKANQDNQTRALAIDALGLIREKIAKNNDDAASKEIEEFLLPIIRDPNAQMVSCAIVALTERTPRSPKAVPALITILKNEKKSTVARWAAITGLRLLRTEAADAIPVLLDILANQEIFKGERAGACRTLGEIGPRNRRVELALKKLLVNQMEDKYDRGAAAMALASMPEAGQATLPILLAILDETVANKTRFEYSDLRMSVILSFSHLKLTKSEVPILLKIATDTEEGTSVRGRAILALGKMGPIANDAENSLEKMLIDEPRFPHQNLLQETLMKIKSAK